jgi:hypothetical protein
MSLRKPTKDAAAEDDWVLLSAPKGQMRLLSSDLEFSEQEKIIFEVFQCHLAREFDPNTKIETGLYQVRHYPNLKFYYWILLS